MKNFSRFQIPFCIGLSYGLVTVATIAQAQETPIKSPATVVAAPAIIAQQWRDDARLTAKITLQAKRMPLSEVLAALSQQSGITLNGGATTKRVTLSVHDMELREAMVALEDLYQADWQAQGEKGYLLHQREMLPWQRNLAQLGNIDDWGYYRTRWSRSFAPPYLTTTYAYDWQELLDSLDRQALESPEGVPFSSLPPEMQSEIRRVTSWEIKHQAIEGAALRNQAETNWTLRIRPHNYPIPYAIEVLHAPIPAKLGPPIGEIVSGDRLLASFPFVAPRAKTAQNPPADADKAR